MTDELTKEIPEELTWDEYQELALETVVFPEDQALEYTVMSLHGECGEISNNLKKVIRDDNYEKIEESAKEAGDALWYGVVHLAYNDYIEGVGLPGPIHDEMDAGRYNQIVSNSSLPDDPHWIDAALELEHMSGRPSTHMAMVRNWDDPLGVKNQKQVMGKCVRHCIYAICMAITVMGHSPREVARHNLLKLRDRAERSKLHGSGDNR